MILPIGAECRLNVELDRVAADDVVNIRSVVGNRDRSLYAALSGEAIFVFLANPQLLLCVYRLSPEDIAQWGHYRLLYWRHDSTSLCATTSQRFLLIYRVTQQTDHRQCYNLVEPRDVHLQRASHELFMKEPRYAVDISLMVVARLDSPATCIVPLKDELFVCLKDGWMHRILWTGKVDAEFSFHLRSIPFSADQLQSKPEHVLAEDNYIADIIYTPLIGGFSLVLADGRAGLLTSPSPRFHPSQLLAVWANNLSDATCTTTSHKFRLVIYGCKNGDVAAYHIDDTNGALIQAYRVSLSVKDNPEYLAMVGPVRQLQCFSQGTALAVVWQHRTTAEPLKMVRPVLALFSPFGTQWWCSLESMDSSQQSSEAYTCVDWGPEAYHLWLGSPSALTLLPLSRAISVTNPNMEHIEHTVMLTAQHILVSPPRCKEAAANAPHSVWRVLTIPHDYLATNWPIRYAAVERGKVQTVLVAGSRGLSHCNLANGKWSLFGNETQEREMIVTGGVALWDCFAVVACYDVEKERDELRFYPLNRRLDNQFASKYDTDSRVLMMNVRSDCLVTFDMLSRLFIYRLRRRSRSASGIEICEVDRCAEIRAVDLVPHAACVVSILPTLLNHDSDAACFTPGIDAVLVNVSGRLIMLSPVQKPNTATYNNDAGSDSGGEDQFQLNQPMLIASYVEQVWHDPSSFPKDRIKDDKPHLSQALWINSGARGMKVWMPLFPGHLGPAAQKESFRNFISKRIMLPFELEIHPSVLCSSGCLALGVTSVPTYLGPFDGSKPFYSLHRNSEVFLHHLLRQLLKRNLGLYALEIAGTCRHLPYFSHVLELLLHHVLEEEATSSEPIPDPLLPRVIAFIQEFPEFLQTIAHCARKTELALWHALFSVTSHPRELFDVCIREGQLETAASFLIVLQNMETSFASREQAAILLEEALSKREWLIARDIVRFLSAIDPADCIDSPPRTPMCQKPPVLGPRTATGLRRLPTMVSPKVDADETNAFVFASYGAGLLSRNRLSSESATTTGVAAARKGSIVGGPPAAIRKDRLTKSQSADRPHHTLADYDYHMTDILNRHACQLIEDCSIRDLGAFAAHLDFPLTLWLNAERDRHAIVPDYVLALMRLHTQFHWPYPLASSSFAEQITRQIDTLSINSQRYRTASEASTMTNETLVNGSSIGKASSSRDSSSISGAKTPELKLKLQLNGRSPSNSTKGQVEEVRLLPVENNDHDSNGLQSPNSPTESLSICNDWEGLDRLCGEVTSRGTEESNAEALFMQNIMEEAGCWDWFLLLCVLRRDMTEFERCLSQLTVPTARSDNLQRLFGGLSALLQWAQANCLGYKGLLGTFMILLSNSGAATANLSPVVDQKVQNGTDTETKKKQQLSGGHSNGTAAVSPNAIGSNSQLSKAFEKTNKPEQLRRKPTDAVVNATTPTNEQSQCSLM